ncbi:MAG: nucleotidyltransferase domain-containing protein [Gammaproteobacteria bacterium]|nr:nucleotidyltransferase domain-containing protein [Gammaproteobacteria bacterium]
MNNRSAVDSSTAQAMDEFIARLREADLPPVQRVLLYGSRARGDYHEESDIDIAVVFPGAPPDAYPYRLLHQLSGIAYEIVLSRRGDVYPSPRPVFEDQLADPSTAKNPEFYQSIAQDGIEWVRMEGYAAPLALA